MQDLRVALVHDYLKQYGGAEKTLEAILELYPNATIYTGFYDPKMLPSTITSKDIIAPRNKLLIRFAKYLTFIMPVVFESFDLRDFDLIISDGTAWPKGVLTRPGQTHIAYIHTPPRFLYKYSVESTKRSKWYFKPFVSIIDHILRTWDFAAAQRPTQLIANSNEVAKRIKKFYKRDAIVIYPPVEVTWAYKTVEKNNLQPPFYTALGRLVAYKNFDFLVNAFNLLELPLTVIGTGPEETKLKKMAGHTITFAGHLTEEEKHKILAQSNGFIFPVVDEDFGISVVEALSHGIPVLAHKSGGPLEIITEGKNGMFFEKLELEHFLEKMREFDELCRKGAFEATSIKASVQKFDKERFKTELKEFVTANLDSSN
jgi:glycosyltransferase involved in cell wall biosynthesis